MVRPSLLPALVGAWGVLNGFAMFILLWDPEQTGVSFAIGLAAAALASFVIETLRDRLKPAEHEDGEPRPLTPTERVARFLVTLVSLATFELFIKAVERAVDVFREPEKILKLREDVLGPSLLGDVTSATRDLVALALLWIIAGAVLSAVLATIVNVSEERPLTERSRRGFTTGIVAGGLIAPLAVLAYILGVRIVLALQLALFHPDQWQLHVDTFIPYGYLEANRHNDIPLPVAAWTLALLVAGKVFTAGLVGKAVAVAILGALIVLARRFKIGWPLGVFVLVLVVTVVAPLARDLHDLITLPILAAIVWIVPGAILGAVTPLLENPSKRATIWTAVAATIGVVVAIVTVARHADNAYLYGAAALVAAALVLRRGDDVQLAWPVLAIAVGLSISSATVVVLHVSASFHSVLSNVARIDALPANVADDPNHVIDDLRYGAPKIGDTFRGIREKPADQRLTIVLAAQAQLLAARNASLRRNAERERASIAAMPAAMRACHARPSHRFHVLGPAPPQICIDRPVSYLDTITIASVESRLEAANDAAVMQRLAADLQQIEAPQSGPAYPVYDGGYSVFSDLRSIEIGLSAEMRNRARADTDIAIEEADARRAAVVEAKTAEEEEAWSKREIPELLELSIAASVAFWTTVALLAAWQTKRDRETVAGEEA